MAAADGSTGLSRGFPPVVGTSPRVLLLGSLPGRASLAAGEYYAQPQNAFWSIMGELCAARPELAYVERLRALTAAGVALWDVLHAARRPGSLDADIISGSEEINDIAGLLRHRRTIGLVGFNGKTAAALFERRIAPLLARRELQTVTLPSTSPAYATLRRADKLARWRAALAPHLRAR
jgi:double-stranded uracil-DNA glycosylase